MKNLFNFNNNSITLQIKKRLVKIIAMHKNK